MLLVDRRPIGVVEAKAQTREGLYLLERLVRPKFMTLHERES